MATFTNVATLSYNGSVTNSNIVTGTINEVLTASKTAVTDSYVAGDDITYVINLVNSGSTPLTGVTVSDDLGAYQNGDTTLVPLTYTVDSIRYFINGALQSTPPTVTLGTGLVISGITVPANGNSTVIYQATANQYAPLAPDAVITNTAIVSGNCLSPVEIGETVRVRNEARLSITKAISPSTVTENSLLTYTFVIQNLGNTAVEAGSDILLTDTFDPILNDITVTFNGEVWSPANYTYNETTGVFSTVEGAITVPAATYEQNDDGTVVASPGVSTIVISGTI